MMEEPGLSTELQLHISCRELPKLDFLTKSDPFVVIYQQDPHDQHGHAFAEIGRSQPIMNTHDPVFEEEFRVNYFFEKSQHFRIDVYDSDSSSKDLAQHDFIGQVKFTLGELVTAPGQQLERPLRDKNNTQLKIGKKRPRVKIKAEEVDKRNNDLITLEMTGHGLAAMDVGFLCFCGKSDPYLEFSRKREDNSWVTVHRTETIKQNLNPKWKPFTVTAQKLCNGDYDRPLKVTCYDWDWNAEPDLIGEAVTSLNALVDDDGGAALVLRRPNGKKGKGYGTVRVKRAKVEKGFSLFEFVGGGMQVDFSIGIDFTQSNKPHTDPASLHAQGNRQNEYQMAIEAVGTVLEPYDSDQQIPVFGFGARVDGGSVSHKFHVNGRQDPDVHGISGVLQAYNQMLPRLTFWGPTLVAPIIKQVTEEAIQNPWSPQNQTYHILLILTDGIISDKIPATEAIVAASKLPISIIIVGVGLGDGDKGFEEMEYLDADDEPLMTQAGETMARDIVQFVPFRKYAKVPHLLPKEVLAEIPEQFSSFIRLKSKQLGHQVVPGQQRAPMVWRAPSAASSVGVESSAPLADVARIPEEEMKEPEPPAYVEPKKRR